MHMMGALASGSAVAFVFGFPEDVKMKLILRLDLLRASLAA